MQTSAQHSEKRLLPDGWKEHFDPQRNLWYYVDLNSEPPRVSLVHPHELNDKSPSTSSSTLLKSPNKDHLRLSPVQRPVGPRESAATSSSGSTHSARRPRRATVAQQLYASSLSVGPKEALLGPTASENGSRSSSRRPSASPTPASDSGVLLSSPVSPGHPASSSSASASSSGCVSPTTPISPLPSLDVHNPRNFLDYTRLAGTRRVTYSGPQPSIGPRSKTKLAPISASTSSQETGGAGVFYPAAVKLGPSPVSQKRSASDPKGHPSSSSSSASALSTQHQHSYLRKDTAKSDTAPSPTAVTSPVPLIKGPSVSPRLPIPTGLANEAWNRQEDISSASGSSRLPSTTKASKPEPRVNVRPLPPTTKQLHVVNVAPPQTPILQPKPVRPLAGVSLNLQVQVAGVKSEPSPEPLADTSNANAHSKRKLKNPFLKSLSLGNAKNAKGKTPIRTIYDRQMLSSSPIIDEFSPVLFETSDLGFAR